MAATDQTIPVLRAQDLFLRPTAMSDLADYHSLLLDSVANRFGHKPPVSLDETEERLSRSLTRQASGELLNWGIAQGAGGPMLGYVCLVRIDHAHQRSEVGYQLRSDHWGKGLMTKALGRVVDYGFSSLGFHRLEGHTDPANRASIAVLERCGFVFEGILRENYLLDGVFHDSAVYGPLAPFPRDRQKG
jgi:[ribosomal protein S5]-alanine N-acetyltransferase